MRQGEQGLQDIKTEMSQLEEEKKSQHAELLAAGELPPRLANVRDSAAAALRTSTHGEHSSRCAASRTGPQLRRGILDRTLLVVRVCRSAPATSEGFTAYHFCCFGVHAEAPMDGALSYGEGLTAQLHAAFASVLKHRDASRLAHPRSLTQSPTANLLLPDLGTLRTVASFIDPHM